MQTTPQQEFDKKYIGSVEICNYLKISRTALFYGRSRGRLPEHIRVPGTNTFLWLREEVMPMLKEWKESIEQRWSRQNEVKNG